MTDKSHAFNALLPLLGSNQDSPDPESVEFGQFSLELQRGTSRTAPESPRAPHGNPHGLSHVSLGAGQ